MDIRAATLTDISEISILLTQLTQEFIAPTCTAEGQGVARTAIFPCSSRFRLSALIYHLNASELLSFD